MSVIQKHRLLAIGTSLGDDALLLTQFSMTEQMGRLFHLEAELASEDPAVDFDKMVGSNATIRLEMPDGKTRHFNGYVSRFLQIGQEGNYARYRATLVPWLWFLTRTADCRIFQKKKVPDIIEEVFKAHGFKDYKLKLSGSYSEWEYCVQYRETDFNFVSRLMEQEGIYYFFKHENGVHTLVLADAPSAHEAYEDYSTLIYRTVEHQSGDATEESITSWAIEKEVQPGVYALGDFNFKNPGAPIVVNANITRKHEAASFEMFDYPGEYDERGAGEAYAKVRIQELQAQHEILRAQATVRGICPGSKFKLKGHPRDDQNRDYLITGATCHAGTSEYEAAGQGSEFYTCSFTAIPAAEHFRSARTTPKPLIQGPQTAMVVGKKGEEIDTDEFGRVKVQFHWDRYGKVDENSSCWVRVSQNVAGKGWGAITIPRIGQEVIVEFLEGDPDQPIITGRVYNATAKVPYPLPDEKTKSTIKTNTSKGGGGFNEIRFEDKKGSEQIFIHGQLDEDIRINNDAREYIGNERHLIVKKDQLEHVKDGDKHSVVKGNRLEKTEGDHGEKIKGDHLGSVEGDDNLSVKGDQKIKVDGDQNLKVAGNWNNESGKTISIKSGQDFQEKAGQNYAMDAGQAVHIKAGMTAVIEAGMQLSLKVGGNFIDIGPAGVAIKGTLVMINSGGAAGSGAGSSPTAPVAPDDPDPPKEAKEAATAKAGEVDKPPTAPKPPKAVTYSASAKVLKYAADDGTPFCEECAKAAAEEVEEEVAVITKIAWLDGADDKELSGDGVQWVNIPHDAKWVDAPNKLTNKDRFGQKVRYKVTFSKPGSHKFKVKVVPGGDNSIYTDPEKGRNANFKYLEQEKEYTTGSDGTKIVETDFFTAAAGGDSFKLVAEDTENNPAVETGLLHTRRFAYVVVVKMKDMTSNADLGTLKSEYLKHGIEIVELPAVEIDRIANIGSKAEEDSYKQKCKAAFDGSQGKAKAPYAIAVGFTEHLAVKNPNKDLELNDVEVGPDKPAAVISVVVRGLNDGDPRAPRKLWKDLVPGEGWFVSCKFSPDGGGPDQNIAEASCTPLPEGRSSCGSVKVDVSKLPAGKGTITLRVNVVDRMRGGISFKGGNLICVCTKSYWTESTVAKQSSTMIHEMGHKVGMVSDGTAKLPDKVETFYEGKGHLGPHCFFDLGDQATYAGLNTNQCVMFGMVHPRSPTAFCVKCVPALRKMDLSAGWPPA